MNNYYSYIHKQFIHQNDLKILDYNYDYKKGSMKFYASSVITNNIYNEDDSDRLKKARLRLAEAQGILPLGSTSDLSKMNLLSFQLIPNLSKVREITWRVAEPEISYDPLKASSTLLQQPLTWLGRNIQIFVPITIFAFNILIDLLLHREEINRSKRAEQILNIISSQSPALIKAGQALSSRSDLLPKAYLDALQRLQDRCPPYPTYQAKALFESEMGQPFDDVFELESPEPVAAASIGQVYKGYLKQNGAKVAIKIQRPGCEESIAVDLFVLRWYAEKIQWFLSLLDRDVSLVSVIDDFGELLYRELDYRAEAVNAQRFSELYASFPDVFVPKMYTDLSSSKVLVMEWVDGARLNDADSLASMGLEGKQFIDTLVQCTMRQMLDNGFFHADPHAGNLLAMPNGKLCYLDFGMVSYVEASQRYSIIEAVVHMVNRDWVQLAELYKRMGFIPTDVDTAPIVVALENALPDVLNSAVGEFNFKNVISKLGDVMYKFPFSLPPFYIAIIRCMGVLEGLAIQVDKDFRIVRDAYPYIASRLLTDTSAELQSALQQLLFKSEKLRWDRLQELLEEASSINDYDISQAVDQMVNYLISEQGKSIREILAQQTVDVLDQLETESLAFLTQYGSVTEITSTLVNTVRNQDNNINNGNVNLSGSNIISIFSDLILKNIEANADPDSSLIAMGRTITIFRSSKGLNRANLSILIRKVPCL